MIVLANSGNLRVLGTATDYYRQIEHEIGVILIHHVGWRVFAGN